MLAMTMSQQASVVNVLGHLSCNTQGTVKPLPTKLWNFGHPHQMIQCSLK